MQIMDSQMYKELSLSSDSDCNLLSEYIVEKYNEQLVLPSINEDVLLGHTVLSEYVQMGMSSEWGYFFCLPLLNSSSDVIDACLILLINENLSIEDKKWNGRIEDSFILDDNSLKELNDNERFMRSADFVSWKNKGLNVKQELCSYAEDVCKNTMNIRCKNLFMSIKEASYSADITLTYSLDCRVYYSNSEVVVDGISTTTLYKIIIKTFREYYDEVVFFYVHPIGKLPLQIRGGKPIEICFPEIYSKIFSRLVTNYPVTNIHLYYEEKKKIGEMGSSAWMGLTKTEAWEALPPEERSLLQSIQNDYLEDL